MIWQKEEYVEEKNKYYTYKLNKIRNKDINSTNYPSK